MNLSNQENSNFEALGNSQQTPDFMIGLLTCPFCHSQYQNHELEKGFKYYMKEQQSLQYLLQFKDLALKKRDEMIASYVEENAKLKENVKNLTKLNERLKMSVPDYRNLALKQPMSIDHSDIQQRPATAIQGQRFLTPAQKQIELIQTGQYNSRLSAKTVTETQGMPPNLSIFANEHGQTSLLLEKEELKIQQNPRFKRLEDFLKSNANYVEKLNRMNLCEQNDLFEIVKILISLLFQIQTLTIDLKNLMILTVRFKRLNKSILHMFGTLNLNEIFIQIQSEMSQLLHCEKAFVYLLDESNSELCAQYKQEQFHLPLSKGIASFVAVNNLSVHIDNAQEDPRFDPSFDQKFCLKTKTVMAIPLKDVTGKIIGVLEVLNKIVGTFTADDEGLLTMLGNLAGIMIQNTQLYDKTILRQNKLLKLIEVIIYFFLKLSQINLALYECLNLEILLPRAEEKLKELMGSDKAVIYLIDLANNSLYHYKYNNQIRKIERMKQGIIGEVIKTKTAQQINEPQKNKLYNTLVDIDTNLPTITVPVKEKNSKQLIAIFQVINLKAGFGPAKKNNANFELDILKHFAKILAICIEKAQKLDEIVEDQIKQKLIELQSGSKRLKKYTQIQFTNQELDECFK